MARQRLEGGDLGAGNTSLLMNACLHRRARLGCSCSARFTTPVLDTLPAPTDAKWRASDLGYSAVSALRKTPFLATPATLVRLYL